MDILNLLNQSFIINSGIEIVFMLISILLLQKILCSKSTNEKIASFVFTNSIVYSLGYLFNNISVSYILVTLSFMITLTYIMKFSKEIVFTFASLSSILMINIHLALFKILNYNSFHELFYSPVCNFVTLTCILFVEYAFYQIVKHHGTDKLLEQAISIQSKSILIASSFILITSSLTIILFFEKLTQNALYFLGLDLIFYVVIAIVAHFCHSEYTYQRLNNLKLCNKTILTMYDDTRAFKHDFHNILQAIGGYITISDMEGLKKYYKQVVGDCKISDAYTKLNPKLINNPAIYNILADKYSIASKNNIEIHLDVLFDLNTIKLNIYELTRILGILLDNAIEASKECEKKNINIAFKQDSKKQLLIIENTYSNKQVSIDKIFEKDYTTKPHNTGLGLWEVRKILKKNSNLNLYTSKNNDYFSQQLEIYYA